jgi:D-alanyl-D-alanine carboxypeptidase
MRLKPARAALLISMIAAAHPAAAGPALLFDATDGKILYAEEMDDQWHPASLTKIMTAYLAFKAIKAGKLRMDDKVICSELANKQPPSKIGLPIGGELTVETALQALIIKSANDVAVMLAEKISGSELQFVADMNATARDLGMTRTTFSNANGLPAVGQVTTARDLAKLARAVATEYPEYAEYWAMTQMRIGKIRLGSHNGLLKTFEGADGLKTGFICDSGFNVVASATRNGRRLMAVVLGEPSGGDRNVRAASLLEHGFQQLGWKQIFNQSTIDNMPVPAEARGPISVRATIQSWDCGNGKRNPAVEARRDRIKAAKIKREKAKKAAAQKKTPSGAAKPDAAVKPAPSGTTPSKQSSAAGTPAASGSAKPAPSAAATAAGAP